MKRNYFLAIAVAVLMLASEVAWAADVSFSGQFRPRYNMDNDASDANDRTGVFDTRVRLNAKANVNANTEVFLQFQSVGSWGVADGNTSGSRVSLGGGGNQASDTLNDVGFHQAYLTLKNFGGYAVDAKIGRQEVVIDGHRLFGHTGWTQGAETKDAIRLTHSGGNHTLGYTFIAGENQDAIGSSARGDVNVHVFNANTQGILGGSLSGIFTITDDSTTDNSAWSDQMTWYTLGARQAGKLGGLDYRVEFYHQFGDAGAIANAANFTASYTGASADGDSVDRNAQLFAIRVGKTFKNAAWKPTITLWYDNLSGTDDDDATDGDWGTFDVMYDTGHKFYGFMDVYLNRTGLNTGYYGLQDIALKTKMSPAPGYTFKADLHHFRTQTDLSNGDGDGLIANDTLLGGAMDPDLGTELDLTLVHKYDANTNIVLGYSKYWTSTTFSQINDGLGSLANDGNDSTGNDDADWAYVMVDTKF